MTSPTETSIELTRTFRGTRFTPTPAATVSHFAEFAAGVAELALDRDDDSPRCMFNQISCRLFNEKSGALSD